MERSTLNAQGRIRVLANAAENSEGFNVRRSAFDVHPTLPQLTGPIGFVFRPMVNPLEESEYLFHKV